MRGIYFLFIKINKPTLLQIGKLGRIKFKKGNYIYIGSAQNNLEKRIERHFNQKKKIYWHIDYLLTDSNIKIEKAYYIPAAKKSYECRLARLVSGYGELIKNFGPSDCQYGGYLVCLRQDIKTTVTMDKIAKKIFKKMNLKLVNFLTFKQNEK